ncbi:MAG: hypothetical protein ACXVAY_06230 [Mucilaginibacter sp.]
MEIVIVGKGIAGLTLSCLLHKKQIPHTLQYRTGDPVGIALAETLPPSAIPVLEKLDLLALFDNAAIHKTYGYHSLWGSDRIIDHNFYFRNPTAYGLKIDKQHLLSVLEKQQADYLVPYQPNLLSGDKFIIDATGRNRTVLTKMGIGSTAHDALIAYSCHVPRIKHPLLTHSVYTETFRDGWGIVSGLNEQENVITLYTDKTSVAGSRLKQYQNWQASLSDTTCLQYFLTGDKSTRVKGSIANSSRASSISGENWLAVGDAAIAFDPLASHGITNAVYTAMSAADAIERFLRLGDQNAVKGYGDSLAAIFDQYLAAKDQLYQRESRWPDAAFWQARQLSPVKDANRSFA